MAALGLGVDVRVLANVGGRVTAAVTLLLLLLLAISIALVHLVQMRWRIRNRMTLALNRRYRSGGNNGIH
jgi:hypothetical protein